MYRHRLPKIEPCNGKSYSNLLLFLRGFEDYADTYHWNDNERVTQVAYYLKDDAKTWYHQVAKNLINEKKICWENFKKEIKEYFLPVNWISSLKDELRKRCQQPQEPLANYVLAKLELCDQIDPTMSEADKLDHLFNGLAPEIARSLYQFQPKSLEEFLDYAKRIERGHELTSSDLNNAESAVAQLCDHFDRLVRSLHRRNSQFIKHLQTDRTKDNRSTCWSCGEKGHHSFNCRSSVGSGLINAPFQPHNQSYRARGCFQTGIYYKKSQQGQPIITTTAQPQPTHRHNYRRTQDVVNSKNPQFISSSRNNAGTSSSKQSKFFIEEKIHQLDTRLSGLKKEKVET